MLIGKTALTSHRGNEDEYTTTGCKMHTDRMASPTGTEPAAPPGQRQGIVGRPSGLYQRAQRLRIGRVGDWDCLAAAVLGFAQATRS
jgi:hypothetical protein